MPREGRSLLSPYIGRAIQNARQKHGWTQQELADRVGVSIKSVDNWENGRSLPRNTSRVEEVLLVDLARRARELRMAESAPTPSPQAQRLADALRVARNEDSHLQPPADVVAADSWPVTYLYGQLRTEQQRHVRVLMESMVEANLAEAVRLFELAADAQDGPSVGAQIRADQDAAAEEFEQ